MLGDPGLAFPLIIFVTAWWSFPYVMVMATAAMQSIPRSFTKQWRSTVAVPWLSFDMSP